MLEREDWLNLARKLDWEYSYVSEAEVFPSAISGQPWHVALGERAIYGVGASVELLSAPTSFGWRLVRAFHQA